MHKHDNRSQLPMLVFQRGLTLVELMIALTISLFLILAATGLLLSTRAGYIFQSEQAQISDTGRFAVEIIARTLRQASYANWDAMEGPVVGRNLVGAAFFGMDARSLKSRSAGVTTPLNKSINGSDILMIGIFGAGPVESGDGSMVNCAGFGVGSARSSLETVTDEDRDWSIFYVAEDATGEPELYCKYRGNDGWASQSIARGVESFQVLYGIDTDGDLVPNRFLSASGIDALDDGLPSTGASAADRAIERGKKSNWRNVVTVKFALLIRGPRAANTNHVSTEYDLFGKEYADTKGSSDQGVRIRVADFRSDIRGRERRLFSATVHLRSRPVGALS